MNTTITEIMEKEVIATTIQARLGDICQVMGDKGVGGLPVVYGDELLGIITENDILRAIKG